MHALIFLDMNHPSERCVSHSNYFFSAEFQQLKKGLLSVLVLLFKQKWHNIPFL